MWYHGFEVKTMGFADRLKEMRAEKGITQVQLAAELGVSKGTVAMWEIGKREPNFEMLCVLSDYFDRRVDYILGKSEDASSIKLTDEQIEQLGVWESEENFSETLLAYLRLDDYGKHTVDSIIKAETLRCTEQHSLLPESDFSINVRLRTDREGKA
jgi:transcriptional regulator with XRE-family HTH domain